MRKILLSLALLLVLPVDAQTPPTDSPPLYIVGAGIGFSRTDTPQTTGLVSFAARVSQIGTYAETKFTNVAGRVATIKAGVRQDLARTGGVTLFASAAGGIATNGSGAAGAIFDGGGGLAYDLGRLSRRLTNHGLSVGLSAEKLTVTDPMLPPNGVHLSFSAAWTLSFGGR